MQPTSSRESGQSQTFDAFDDELRQKYNLKTDKEIEALPHDTLVEEYKKTQYTIVAEKSKNKRLIKEINDLKTDHIAALAHSTTQQAVSNLQENQRNRIDFDGMQRETTLCTGGRVVSLITTIAIFIITLVCILL